jgi:hypothetical protein
VSTAAGADPHVPVDELASHVARTERAAAPQDWFAKARDYATAALPGGVQALYPVPGADLSTTRGFDIADYLHQYGVTRRQHTAVPAAVWEALAGHLTHPLDVLRLADAARSRGLYRFADRYYRSPPALHGPPPAHRYAWNGLHKLLWDMGERTKPTTRSAWPSAQTRLHPTAHIGLRSLARWRPSLGHNRRARAARRGRAGPERGGGPRPLVRPGTADRPAIPPGP